MRSSGIPVARFAIPLIVIGLLTCFGWAVGLAPLVRWHPAFYAMVLNAATCFILLGAALLLPSWRGLSWQRVHRLQGLAGWLVLGYALGTLLEHAGLLKLHLEWSGLHAWIDDGNPAPGRPSPVTALGLALSAATLLLMRDVRSRGAALLIPALTFSVLAAGLIGLVSQAARIDAALGWFNLAHGSVAAAICLLLTACALWSDWQRPKRFRRATTLNHADRLTLLAVSILVVVGGSIGLLGIVAQERLLERELSERFERVLTTRAAWFRTELEQELRKTQRLAAAMAIAGQDHAGKDNGDFGGRRAEARARDMLALRLPDVASLRVQGRDGRILLSVGQISKATALRLRNHPDAALLDDEGWLLRTEAPFMTANGPARLVVDQRFSVMEPILLSNGFGPGWDLRICAPPGTRCLPTVSADGRIDTPPLVDEDQWLSIARTVGSGDRLFRVKGTSDDWLAGRILLDDSGLSLVAIQGARDLYAPIRDFTLPSVLMLVLFVIGGGLLLGAQIQPLAARLVRSEERFRAAARRLQEAHEDMAHRVKARTAELQASNEALTQKRAELREVAAHHQRLVEEERKRIAREVHDELGGQLTALRSYVSTSLDRAAAEGRNRDPLLLEAVQLADAAVGTVRRVITDLRPSVLDQLGLWAALEWQAGQFEERSGIPCSFEIDEGLLDEASPDAQRSTAVFRIVQEALTNVERHAGAANVALTVERQSRHGQVWLCVSVDDDGRGIAPQAQRRQGSWGLVGMHERAEYFGGRLQVSSEPGGGTRLRLTLPMAPSDVAYPSSSAIQS